MKFGKESFVRSVTCQREGYKVENVPCKFYIPLRRDERVVLKLRPNDEQREILQYWWDFSIEAETINASNTIKERIYTPNVYWKYDDHEYIHWGGEDVERILACEPSDLKITHYKAPQNISETEEGKTKGTFWITPSSLLAHVRFPRPHDSGGFTVETSYQSSFSLPDGISVVYRQKPRHYQNDSGELVTFSEPVLECDLSNIGINFQQENVQMQWLDDFLLVLSFASRHSSRYLGWEIEDAYSSTTYYRNNVILPSPKTSSFDDELISKSDIEEFINSAVKKISLLEKPESIRLAIVNTIPRGSDYLDSSYILLYAALETLILDFRRKKGMEFIFNDESEFKAFRLEVQKFIKNHPITREDKDKNKRELLYEKLPELSRVSFKRAFKEFCIEYNLSLDDLWPVIGKPSDTPLSDIRNKIVHGDIVDYDIRNALWCARENLRWCVERMILAVLGWPIDNSRASAKYLSGARMTCHDWKPYRDAYSNLS